MSISAYRPEWNAYLKALESCHNAAKAFDKTPDAATYMLLLAAEEVLREKRIQLAESYQA